MLPELRPLVPRRVRHNPLRRQGQDETAGQLATAATAVGAFFLAILIWSVLLASLASYGRTLVTAFAFRWLNAGAGVCMALFGVGLIWRTLAAL